MSEASTDLEAVVVVYGTITGALDAQTVKVDVGALTIRSEQDELDSVKALRDFLKDPAAAVGKAKEIINYIRENPEDFVDSLSDQGKIFLRTAQSEAVLLAIARTQGDTTGTASHGFALGRQAGPLILGLLSGGAGLVLKTGKAAKVLDTISKTGKRPDAPDVDTPNSNGGNGGDTGNSDNSGDPASGTEGRANDFNTDGEAGDFVGSGTVINKDGIGEVEFRSELDQAEFNRLNEPDAATGRPNPSEAEAAVRLQGVLGGALKRNPKPEGGDFIITSGSRQGQSVDFLYTVDASNPRSVAGFNDNFARNFAKNNNGPETIIDHLNKADIVPLDFRNLTPSNQKIIEDFIITLSSAQKKQLIIIR